MFIYYLGFFGFVLSTVLLCNVYADVRGIGAIYQQFKYLTINAQYTSALLKDVI